MREKYIPPEEKNSESEEQESLEDLPQIDKEKKPGEINEASVEAIKASRETLVEDLNIDPEGKTEKKIAQEITDKLSEGSPGILKKLNEGKTRKALKTLILGAGLLAAGTGLEGYLRQAKAGTTEGIKTEQTMNEQERHQLGEMQNYAMEFIDKKFEEYCDRTGNEVSEELLNKSYDFQNKLWKMAYFILKDEGNMDNYRKMVDRLYQDEFAPFLEKGLAQSGEEKVEQKKHELGDLIESELPESHEIDEDWAWQNENKIFKQGNKILVVKSASSTDLQVSVDKATLMGRGVLSETLAKLKGQATKKKESVKGGTKITIESQQTLRGSRKIFQKIKKEGNRWQAVVVMEVEIPEDSK